MKTKAIHLTSNLSIYLFLIRTLSLSPAPLLWVPSDIIGSYSTAMTSHMKEFLLSGNFHITFCYHSILGIFIFWESSFSASFQFLGVFNFNVVFWEYSILGIFILGIFIWRVFITPPKSLFLSTSFSLLDLFDIFSIILRGRP